MLRNPTARTPFDRAETPKEFFFITFKAGMLLKTHENRTKYTNFEGLFRRKCAGFARFGTNCSGFAGLGGNPEVYWNDRCQLLGRGVGGLNWLRKNSLPQLTTTAMMNLNFPQTIFMKSMVVIENNRYIVVPGNAGGAPETKPRSECENSSRRPSGRHRACGLPFRACHP